MNTKLFYIDQEVTQSQLKDIIEQDIRITREAFIEANDYYYKTYVFLKDNRRLNHLIFDPTIAPSKAY
jgi:hypothetical protein